MFKSSRFKQFLSNLPFTPKPKSHSLGFLNSAQFLGVINDNLFKLVIIFLLIETLGKENASSILSAVGAIFVLPFLLFSSAGGILADCVSKQRFMMLLKGFEIIIMVLAIAAFSMKSAYACYGLLFLLATHSALFGPSKYGIIPELVPPEKVSRANGLITSFTYLGIIIGTFLASFLTEITGHRFPLIAALCLVIAALGFLSTFGIQRTAPQGSDKKVNIFFVREIFRTLVSCKEIRHLLPAIFGSAFFLFIGAYTQLNIIPFAMDSLSLSDVAGGYLFLSTALGIACGSFLAGRLSKNQIELGLPCVCGFLISALLLLLPIFSWSLSMVIILLVLLGIFGGCFIVPFDTFIQVASPNEKRGQVIAAANFLSFVGVLIASIALYVFSNILGLSPASGFALVGLVTLIISLIFTARLSDLAFPFFAKKIIAPFHDIKTQNLELVGKNPSSILVLQKGTWKQACLLMTIIPNIQWLLLKRSGISLKNMFYSIQVIKGEEKVETITQAAKALPSDKGRPVLFISNHTALEFPKTEKSFLDFFKFSKTTFIFVNITKRPDGSHLILFSETPQ
jgi:acyl-[acyl-carrier-protein]-phospholipid O-acyltransferase/long-chain-fatty-acid--[acyl-carrier-protein] ligase